VKQPAQRPRSQRLAVLYLQLAEATAGRGPASTHHRLLLLAGRHAADSEWNAEADICRELVLASNPHHAIGHYHCFADALAADDYIAFDRQLERQCPQEKAEHLAEVQHVDTELAVREPPRLIAHDILARLTHTDRDTLTDQAPQADDSPG
jgi:hypothetical protein